MAVVNVTVEFLGIVRHRTGCESAQFQAETMHQLWTSVAARFPELEGTCLADGTLQPGYLASVGGFRFTRASDLELSEGDRILLLSADAGG